MSALSCPAVLLRLEAQASYGLIRLNSLSVKQVLPSSFGYGGGSRRVLGKVCKRRRWLVESKLNGSGEKAVHFVGIGGTGLSALALIALQQAISIAAPRIAACEWSIL